MSLKASSFLVTLGWLIHQAAGQCIADETINGEFASFLDGYTTATTEADLQAAGTCCQQTICNIPCPEEVAPPGKGYGIAVAVFMAISALIGILTVLCIKGKSENYFVAGRSLPLWVVAATLASQSIDSNAILGNVDLSYKFHFYDGAVLPIGLGLSLILNAIFFAGKINKDGALTLPDVYAKRYGKVVEVLVSICTIISFMFLLAGNLVGMGTIIQYLYGGITLTGAIIVSAVVVLVYTITGGLFSVAYTDVFQATIGWLGCVSLAFYMIKNAEQSAPPQSTGFPGYSYPDDETCALYDGVPCENQDILNPDGSLRSCCYNSTKYGPDGIDNGAYLFADAPVIPAAMTAADGLTPFPNAIVFNWATIFVLGFGNLAALDFQARCMASKTPKIATIGCLIAAGLTFFVGIPFSYLGAITRTYYGPDTARASFETDTCSTILELPTCALWNPDSTAFIKLLTHEAPPFLGAWCLVGIVAASMSTCDGAILAMGTVFSHNVVRQFGGCVNNKTLLWIARAMSIPFAILATVIACLHKSTGYLLIVAFDVVLASVVVPLFGCFYTKKPSPLAALLSILAGATTRVILEFALPKDGYLIAPFNKPEFMNVGPAASSLFPSFFDEPIADRWDPSTEKCDEVQFDDWSGVDSLVSPLVGLIVFVTVQFLERNGPLIKFKEGGLFQGYLKEGQGGYEENDDVVKDSEGQVEEGVDVTERE